MPKIVIALCVAVIVVAICPPLGSLLLPVTAGAFIGTQIIVKIFT